MKRFFNLGRRPQPVDCPHQPIVRARHPREASPWEITLAHYRDFCQALTTASGQPLYDVGVDQARAMRQTDPPAQAQALFVLADTLAQTLPARSVTLFDAKGGPIGAWAPLTGPMTAVKNAHYYAVEAKTNPVVLEGLWSLLLVHLAPRQMLHTLYPSLDAYARPPATRLPAARDAYLDALLATLRELLAQPDCLNHNHPGTLGWRVDDTLFVIGKALSEALRAHPRLYAYQGRLRDNSAIYRTLIGGQIAQAAPARALWQISLGSAHGPMKVAALRLALDKLWPDPGRWPERYRGALDIVTPPPANDSSSGYANLFSEQ